MTQGTFVEPTTATRREGLPTPCLGCGAPMTATAPTTLHADPTLTCRFCGRSESIPADAAAQDRFLRMRLMQVRRSREGMEAPLRTFETVRQSWAFALVFLVGLGGWNFWQMFVSAEKAPLENLIWGVFSCSVVVGLVVGYVGMHRAFRELVRPLLLARAPLERGLAARCRSCGGELPAARTGQSRCDYCGADNFLDASAAQDINALLHAEEAEYQRRVTGGKPFDPAAFEQPGRQFLRWAVAGAGVTFVVGAVVVLIVS